ncbi:thioredoxin family protein [Deinococcus sp. UYEF24]
MKSDAASQIAISERLKGHLPDAQVQGWTLLLIWASWSASARRLKQELGKVVLPLEVKVLSLRVEDATPIITALAIPSVPYLVLFHAGTEVARHPGDGPLSDVLEWIQAWRSG